MRCFISTSSGVDFLPAACQEESQWSGSDSDLAEEAAKFAEPSTFCCHSRFADGVDGSCEKERWSAC